MFRWTLSIDIKSANAIRAGVEICPEQNDTAQRACRFRENCRRRQTIGNLVLIPVAEQASVQAIS